MALRAILDSGMAVTPQGIKIPILKRQYKYHATFLHDHEDFDDIKLLIQLLEDRGVKCALPGTREVLAGQREFENLEYCLKSSKCSVICLSPNFVRDSYHSTEWNLALWRHKTTKARHRIVPLILKKSYIPDSLNSFGPIQLCYQKNVIISVFNRIMGKPHVNRVTAKFLHRKCVHLARQCCAGMSKYRRARLAHIQYDTVELQAINAEMNLRVECPNQNCSHMCYRRELPTHLATCQHTTLRCKYKPCDFKGVRKVMTKHVLECCNAEVTCPNSGCVQKVTRNVFKRHGDACEHGFVKCPNWGLFHRHSYKRKDNEKHRMECAYEIVPCSNIKCDVKLARFKMVSHERKCALGLAACRHKLCDVVLEREKLKHHELECIHQIVKCQNCNLKVKKHELDSHKRLCKYSIVSCQNPGCKEVMFLHEKAGHLDICKYRLFPCPVKECKHECYRWELKGHVNICPHWQIRCLCGELVYRDDLFLHYSTCRSKKTACNASLIVAAADMISCDTCAETCRPDDIQQHIKSKHSNKSLKTAEGSFWNFEPPSSKTNYVFATSLDESEKSWWSKLFKRFQVNVPLAPLHVAGSPFRLYFLVKMLYQNQLLTADRCEKILNDAKKIGNANPGTTINATVYKALHNYDTRFSKIISDYCEKFKNDAEKEFEFSKEVITAIDKISRDCGNKCNATVAPVYIAQGRRQQRLSDSAMATLYL